MISRTRFLITVALICHSLLTPRLVTSQLLSVPAISNDGGTPPKDPSTAPHYEDVTIKATDRQEKDGPIYKLRGHVEIHYGAYTLFADEMTYNSDTGEATGEGHMMLDG